jgi:hypothetical protein
VNWDRLGEDNLTVGIDIAHDNIVLVQLVEAVQLVARVAVKKPCI